MTASTDTRDRGRTRQVLLILSLALAAVVPYLNTLDNAFVYDDKVRIVGNDALPDLGDLMRTELARNRPVSFLTYHLDHRLWKLDPTGWHVTNIVLHLVATLVVFLVLRRLLVLGGRAPDAESRRRADWIAWGAALLFATHPVHTEAVTCISNRQDVLMTIFLLGSLHFYGVRRRRPLAYAAALVCLALAAGSKQTGLLGVLLWVLWDLWFEPGPWRERLRRRLRYYLPFPLAALLLLFFLERLPVSAAVAGSPPIVRVNAVLDPLLRYLGLLAWPRNLSVNVPVHIPPGFDLRALGGAAVLVALGFLIRWARPSRHALGLAAAGFLVAWVPLSNLVPRTFLVAERYLYLPSAWFLLAVSWLLCAGARLAARRVGASRTVPLFVAACVVLAAAGGTATWRRNRDWRDDESIWRAAVATHPSSVSHYHLGTLLMEKGDREGSIAELEAALAAFPGHKRAANNLGIVLMRSGRVEEARRAFLRARAIDPEFFNPLHNLACVASLAGDMEEADRWLRELLRIGKLDQRLLRSDRALAAFRESPYHARLLADIAAATGGPPEREAAPDTVRGPGP